MIIVIILTALMTYCIWNIYRAKKHFDKMEKAIIKFNSGRLALLCSGCRTIIKTGRDFTPEEREFAINDKHLDPQYCEKCNNVLLEEQVNT